jgi:hypothetical protein
MDRVVLLPLDREDQVPVALGADVELARGSGDALRRERWLGLEVDDLDGAAGGEDDLADVVAGVRAGGHDGGVCGVVSGVGNASAELEPKGSSCYRRRATLIRTDHLTVGTLHL